jgi:hypothetical protein
MEITYKGFKGEKVIDEGKELILLAGEELDDIVWIENDEIRATNLEALQKILVKYGMSNVNIKEEHFHPGLIHYIVDIKNI